MARAISTGRPGRRSGHTAEYWAQATPTAHHPADGEPQPLARQRPSLTADLAYDAFFGGGIGGSTIALFFLLMDVLAGQPLYTPSMMGAALFDRVAPAAAGGVRLDMVAYFSILHFVTFALLSVGLSYIARASRVVEGHLLVMAAIVFSVLTAFILVADWLFMPGVVATLGYGQVIVANALTGLAMAAFMKWSHRPGRYGGDGGDVASTLDLPVDR